MAKLKRDDLVRLVHRIQTASGCIMDLDALITTFENNVPNPESSQLIFDPPSGKKLTPEQIVDIALNQTQ